MLIYVYSGYIYGDKENYGNYEKMKMYQYTQSFHNVILIMIFNMIIDKCQATVFVTYISVMLYCIRMCSQPYKNYNL